MSETDDTDVLLLIPPTFFLVNTSGSEESFLESSRTVVHKPVSCTANVIGKLVNQVQSLESRLDTLELDTSNTISSLGSRKVWDTESFESRSLDRRCFTFPRRRCRKTRKERSKDVSLLSLDTAKNGKDSIYKHVIDYKSVTLSLDEPQSMDGDLSSIVSTPSKKTDKLLLHEIDEFLTKVESYEAPESKAKEGAISSENVIRATGEYIMNSMNSIDTKSIDNIQLPSGRVVPSSVLDKYIYLVKNKQSQSNSLASAQNYPSVSACNTLNYASTNTKQDAKSPSIRKLNFSENKDVQPTSTPKRNTQPNYSDSFKPSSNKILDRASKVLENYRSQSYSCNFQSGLTEASDMSSKKDEFKLPHMRPFCLDNRDSFKLESIDTDLLSLSELWGERGERNEKIDSNKLEEERLKREHCEAMIQQLQKKLLEQQEKLAVAVKVDRAKDAAINKLRDAWLKLTGSLDRAEERHRAALEKMVREMDNFKMVADEAQKKTIHFEKELYKALDLAHDYQEQCKLLTIEKKDLQENIEKVQLNNIEALKQKDNEIITLKENYETVMQLNKQATDCIKNLEEALHKEKTEYEETQNKTAELCSRIENIKQEKVLIEQERDILKNKVSEERGRCNMLDTQLGVTREQVSELVKRCDTLDTENKTLRRQLEAQKSELKNHYQAQLESAVLGKLTEFQEQLERAERDLQQQGRLRERSLADRMHHEHKLEINVLEEKQKEEVKLYRLQLAQASERISLLESKLDSYRRRRGELASQLHGVMQAQWKQALLILTSQHRTDTVAMPSIPDFTSNPPPLSLPQDALRPQKEHFDNISDQELQQYVQLLLTKPPGDLEHPPLEEEPTRERRERGRSLQKPPWKS